MKRSPMPPRKTPMARGTSGLKRTPFVDHKAAVRRSAQATFSAAVRTRAGGVCEACPLLVPGSVPHPGAHAHHMRRKGQGGSDDPSNGKWCCVVAHNRIHAFPEYAESLGLLKSACTPQGTPSTLDTQ